MLPHRKPVGADEPTSAVRKVPRVYDSVPDENASTTQSDVVAELAQIAHADAIPVVVYEGDVKVLPLDPHAAFVLGRIDGSASIGAIVDGSPLGEDATVYVLAQLVAMKLVTFRRG
ncbi:MAG TPA: hypothetical protein VIF62_12425 [Labilithrix sp.]|jgi:hypothetical protein